jgi:hypothetical protein
VKRGGHCSTHGAESDDGYAAVDLVIHEGTPECLDEASPDAA